EAERLFARLAAEPTAPRAPEAMFWLGALAALRTGDLQGAGWWTRLTASAPDDPWAWKAAAHLLGTGAFVNGQERPTWPDAHVLRDTAAARAALHARASRAPTPTSTDDLDQARASALRYLLATQRPDGAWPCPVEELSLVR